MRMIGFAGVLALASLACQKKEETVATKPPAPAPKEAAASPAPAPAAEEKKEEPESKPTKASERPAVTEKKPPVAEPVADRPGYVKSPFSGSIIDVKGIPGGTLVADPMFPASEKKHFRVPEMSPEDEAKAAEELAEDLNAAHDAQQNLPEAQPIPGKAGFYYSPYDNKIIDATGYEPGATVEDPGSPEGSPRFFKIPGAKAPAEGD